MVFTITDIYSFFHVRIHNRDYASLSRWFWFSWVSVERNWLTHRRWFYSLSQPLDSVRNLGSWFESNMCMSIHIGKICSKAFHGLYKIRQIRKFLSPEFTKTLVHAFVTSHLDYCNSLLFGVLSTRQIVFMRCLTPLLDLSLGFQSLITFRPPYLIFTGFLLLIAFILSCYS